MLGGNANNGTNAGFVYVNSNNAPSNANTNIGSRTCSMSYEATASPLGGKYNWR